MREPSMMGSRSKTLKEMSVRKIFKIIACARKINATILSAGGEYLFKRWLILMTLGLFFFMVIIDGTIVVVAVPTIAQALAVQP